MVSHPLPPGSAWSFTKAMRVMKITAVFLLGCFFHVSASFSQAITLKVKNAPLKEVLAAVKKQTGYAVFYNAELLADAKPVTLDLQNASLADVLKAAFNGQPLNYVIENKTIFISRGSAAPAETKRTIELNLSLADPVKIRVTDAEGQPLTGATVAVTKSKKSGVTDAQGNITLNLDAGEIITVSYVGYVSQEIKLAEGKNSLMVVLQTKPNTNDEVVVMAYGQKKRKTEMVGSAYQVNADRIANLPAGRIDALLDGQVPGLRVTLNTDDASSTKPRMNLRLRGTGSFNASNEPLWIVDGTPFFTGDRTNMVPGIQTSVTPLSYINPEDIESITVLKDAAAAAIYGANASNGVILITTKSGKKSAPVWNLSLQNGFSRINKNTKYKTLNGAEYMELAKESFVNADRDLTYFPYNDNDQNNYSQTNTDWTDEFYGTGIVNNATLSLRGGTDKLDYAVSGGFFNNKATIKGNTQMRASVSANLKYKITKKLEIGAISRYSFNKNNTFNPGMDYLDFLPIFSPYNNDGTYRLYNKKITGTAPNGDPIYTDVKFFNSVAEREQNDDIQKGNVLNNNFTLGYEIIKGLKSTTQYGIDYQEIKQNIYSARTNWSGMDQQGNAIGYASRSYNKTVTKTFIERLNYSKSFGVHHVSGLAGFELYSKKYNTTYLSVSGFDDDNHRDVSNAKNVVSNTYNKREEKQASYFGQLEYNYDRKYYIQFTGRRDGSSTFGSDARWGNFASAGIGWNLKQDLFSDIQNIDYLRLDATYGKTGNSRLSNQEIFGIYAITANNGYDGQDGAILSNIPNPLLRWEAANQTNLKLNLGLFNKLTFLVEAYRKKTVDAIVSVPVSRATGETSAQSNTGILLNEGIEATVRWNVINNERKQFSWWVEVNAAHNKNTALELYNDNGKANGNYIWTKGKDINTLYLIRWAGVDPRDGAPLWYDFNGNLTRSYSIDNRVPWKSANPDLFGGVRNQIEYKQFSLSALISYQIGGYAFSTFGRGINSDGLNIEADNQSVNQLDRWQRPGDVAINPKPIWGISTRSVMNSTRFVHKTTFVRLQNLSLGYALPEKTVKKLNVKACTVNLIGNELGFWTPYDKTNRNSYKQSRSGYPLETSFLLAINVTF
ncbi:SusC/RagA family TonB-linked outer membrane protein [Pseudobacter ginsenosidimutans]|uniref:TonB-linked SusC/RagA family outer membrane protein n=1 Tax=Pseudobacter ginsenosidimutans TaxID=661488 RepID=A0A4Q7MZF0_9BACT|nr:SusC/RagA family TonB-linked outer membrane protein [Pseudobacter ginsenosidimutans]QEC42909.1 SusC/RagA family TonB-linked outer membrane protein [Pseudobacter ginsenosidimutans]RZS74262.1 TonB-linked SusC/RagA family outer membrane protein [Pseudobacter ginsenosidimutans]